MASDGIRQRELEAEEWFARATRRAVALAELNPQPMPEPPADGRCPRVAEWKSSCKSRACPVCGPGWARRQQTKVRVNLEHYGGKVATIAVTAPGAKVLPWACEKNHVHSGTRGCRVQARPLREWCSTLGWRWRKLRDAAQLETKRTVGGRVVILERVWEPQKRGAPHVHLVVPYGTFDEMRRADVFRAELARLAAGYGFGRVQGTLRAISGEDAARYLASYLTGRRRKKSSIRENIADPRLPKSLLWEAPALSSVSVKERMVAMRQRLGLRLGTGVTMRTLRRVAHLHACFNGVCDYYPRWAGAVEAVVTAAVFRTTAPKRAGPLGDFAGALALARQVDARTSWPQEWNPETRRVEMPEKVCRDLAAFAFDATRGAPSPSVEGSNRWQTEPSNTGSCQLTGGLRA